MNRPESLQDWRRLAVLSVRDPAEAAHVLMAMRLRPDVLWHALALVAVANTFLFLFSIEILGLQSPYPAFFSVPLVNFAIIVTGLALMVFALVWTGRIIGGKGSVRDVLVLMIWVQIIQALIQMAAYLMLPFVPLLANILTLAGSLLGLYMLVHFINESHRLGSLGKSAAVLVAALLAVVVGLSIIAVMVGGPDVGSNLEL